MKTMGIRVLIDAGAQILEMDNNTLAKAWLDIDYEAPAVVYFEKDNKPWVLYRKISLPKPYSMLIGIQVKVVNFLYWHRLSLMTWEIVLFTWMRLTREELTWRCLVCYLKSLRSWHITNTLLIAKAVGALTLGLGQTKDHTVQAAMRLRQLATSQEVVFFAPPEVHQSILDLRKNSEGTIDSYDVVCWLLEQTCSGIEQLQPLYYSQGIDFCRRTQAALSHPDISDEVDREVRCSPDFLWWISNRDTMKLITLANTNPENSRI